MLDYLEMIDKILITIAAKIRLKKYLWPSHTDPYFYDKISRLRAPEATTPRKRYLKGVQLDQSNINGYACYQISKLHERSSGKILYIHGGAFVFPILQSHWRFVTRLVRETGQTAIVPLYPLVPENTYKQVHTHLQTVYLQLIDSVSPGDVTVIGDSAGGNLSIVLPFLVDEKLQPKQVIALSPVLDLRACNPEMEEIEPKDPLLPLDTIRYLLPSYYRGGEATDPMVSPTFADYERCRSKLAFFNGGKDILSPEIKQLHDKLLGMDFKHEYIYESSLPHVWPLLPLFAARTARKRIVRMISEQKF